MKPLKLWLIICLIAFACEQNDPLPTGNGPAATVESVSAVISNDTNHAYVVVSKKAGEITFTDGVVIEAGETNQLPMARCCSHVIRAFIKSDLINHKFEWHVNPRNEDIHISF